jgi:hypothetical protein
VALETIACLSANFVAMGLFFTMDSWKEGFKIPYELVRNIGKQTGNLIIADSQEIIKFLRHAYESIREVAPLPSELIKETVLEFFQVLKSGALEFRKWDAHLSYGMPEDFIIHLVFPYERWWIPKKEKIKAYIAKVQEARRKRIEAINTRIEVLQRQFQLRLEQIRKAISTN